MNQGQLGALQVVPKTPLHSEREKEKGGEKTSPWKHNRTIKPNAKPHFSAIDHRRGLESGTLADMTNTRPQGNNETKSRAEPS